MRKLSILFVLMLSLFSGSISCFAEDEQNGEAVEGNVEAEEAIEEPVAAEPIVNISRYENYSFLNALELTDKNVNVDSNAPITRREFAILFAKLIGKDYSVFSGAENAFEDVTSSAKGYKEISALYSLGVMNGKGNRTFGVDDTVSVYEACVVMCRLTGYSKFINDDSYVSIASSKDLLKNIKSENTDSISVKNAYQMVYNVLFSNILETDYSTGKVEYTESENTVLEARFKVFEIEGMVVDDGVISLYGETKISKDSIVIGNTELINKTNRTDLIGYNVKGYYCENKDDYELKYVEILENKVSTAILKADLIDSFDGEKYEAYETEDSSRTVKYRIEKNNRIIYNGKIFSGTGISQYDFLNMMKPESGYVRLIDNDKNDRYEIIIVKNYHHLFVKAIDVDGKVISCGIKPNKEIPSEQHPVVKSFWKVDLGNIDDENLIIRDEFDNPLTFNYILSDSVISIALSADNLKAELLVSNNNVESSKQATMSEDEMVLEGKSYKFTNEYAPVFNRTRLTSGNVVKYYLTFDNKIAFSEIMRSDGVNYVFLQKAYYDDTDESLLLKICTAENSIESVRVADKVTIDGVRYSDSSEIKSLLEREGKNAINNGEGRFKGNVAIVKYNGDGEINYIDLPYGNATPNGVNESENSWHIIDDLFQTTKFTSQYTYGEYSADYDTVIFAVSKNGDEIVTTSRDGDILFPNGSPVRYTSTAYQFVKGQMIADAIVMYYESDTVGIDLATCSSDLNPAIVMEVSDAVNTFGEVCTKLKVMYVRTRKGTRDVVEDVYTESENGAYSNGGYAATKPGKGRKVQAGDIIKFGTNAYGIIPDNQLTIMYSPSSGDEPYYTYGSMSTLDIAGISDFGMNIFKVNVYDIDDKYVRLLQNVNGVEMNKSVMFNYVLYSVYDDGEVLYGTYADLEGAYARGDKLIAMKLKGNSDILKYYIIRQ